MGVTADPISPGSALIAVFLACSVGYVGIGLAAGRAKGARQDQASDGTAIMLECTQRTHEGRSGARRGGGRGGRGEPKAAPDVEERSGEQRQPQQAVLASHPPH